MRYVAIVILSLACGERASVSEGKAVAPITVTSPIERARAETLRLTGSVTAELDAQLSV